MELHFQVKPSSDPVAINLNNGHVNVYIVIILVCMLKSEILKYYREAFSSVEIEYIILVDDFIVLGLKIPPTLRIYYLCLT